MFSQIVSLIALLPMLLHSVLGCCWHHVHDHAAAVSTMAADSAQSERADQHHCCQHHHRAIPEVTGEAGSHSGSDREPAPHSPCDEVRCELAMVATVTTASAALTNPLLEAAWLIDGSFDLKVCVSPFRAHAPSPVLLPRLASSRRAFMQIWLI